MNQRLYIPTVPSNPHLSSVIEYFGDFTPEPANIPDTINFIFLCYTNRSGSNYLASLLASG
ncbi:MAG TPA: hypothetical protein PLY97_11020, partial [Acidocella sp.]|nr:hypothetical protein [Acidocella sp.]